VPAWTPETGGPTTEETHESAWVPATARSRARPWTPVTALRC